MEGVVLPTSWPLAAQGRAARRTTAVVSSSGRAGRQLEGRASARSSSLRPAGERESEERESEERERERETERARRRPATQCLLLRSPISVPFLSILIATQPLNCAHPPTCLCHGCQLARVLHASVESAACVLVPRVSERERERSCGGGSNYPSCHNARPFDR